MFVEIVGEIPHILRVRPAVNVGRRVLEVQLPITVENPAWPRHHFVKALDLIRLGGAGKSEAAPMSKGLYLSTSIVRPSGARYCWPTLFPVSSEKCARSVGSRWPG